LEYRLAPVADPNDLAAEPRSAVSNDRHPFDIVGQYEAFVVVAHLDAAIAREILPDEFELAPPADTPAGKHPVMYSFGKHRHVHPRAIKAYEYDYDEALIGLPHIAFPEDSDERFFHMTAVRLNNALATMIGAGLGFPKKMATIENTDTTYAIRTTFKKILRGDMRVTGKKFKDDHPNFAKIAPMMLQPVISKGPLGSIMVTKFSIDTARAFMLPATMEIEARDDSLPGLPKGLHRFDSIEATAFGGAYLSIHSWRLSQSSVRLLRAQRQP
jgi:hypothetical protein